jgi:hypothetical protein
MTGYRSEELGRYKHLSPDFLNQTTGLIAGKLTDELEGTFWDALDKAEKSRQNDDSQTTDK